VRQRLAARAVREGALAGMPAFADAAFAGHWVDDEGTELHIDGCTVHGPGGGSMDLEMKAQGKCTLELGGEMHEGKLSADGSKLLWSDGAVWVRKRTRAAKTTKTVKLPDLSLEQVLNLQRDLYAGFSSDEFQDKLAEHELLDTKGSTQWMTERSELFLTVQGQVLPKYGFESTQSGVVHMLQCTARFNSNPEYRQNREMLNELLGLTSAEGKVEASPSRVAEEKAATPPARDFAAERAARRDGSTRELPSRPSTGASRWQAPGDVFSLSHSSLLPRGGRPQRQRAAKPQKPCAGRRAEAAEESPRVGKTKATLTIAKPPSPAPGPVEDVEVVAREAVGDLEVRVVVPSDATFQDLKQAISKHVGNREVLQNGHLVCSQDGLFKPHKPKAVIGNVREVLVLAASLAMHDDHAARAWRRELEEQGRAQPARRSTTSASQEAPSSGAGGPSNTTKGDNKGKGAVFSPPSRGHNTTKSQPTTRSTLPEGGAREPPFGKCFVVGSWDGFSGRHEMAWDCCGDYRLIVQLGESALEESFQIIAHGVSSGKRIYPSINNANKRVPHETMGPDANFRGKSWIIGKDDIDASEFGAQYEVTLHCPQGCPSSVDWAKIARLD